MENGGKTEVHLQVRTQEMGEDKGRDVGCPSVQYREWGTIGN